MGIKVTGSFPVLTNVKLSKPPAPLVKSNLFVIGGNSPPPDFIRVDLDGNLLSTFSGLNTDNFIGSVNMDNNENVYVVSSHDTSKVTSADSIEWTYTPNFQRYASVAPSGNVAISEGNGNRVTKRDSNNTQIWRTSTGATVNWVAFDTNENVYAALEDNTVLRLNSSTGTADWKSSDLGARIFPVAAGLNGDVYAGDDNGLVHKLGINSGNLINSFSLHSARVLALSLDQNSNIFTASGDNFAKKSTSSGSLIWQSADFGENVRGIDVDTAGNAYTVTRNAHLLTKFAPDGTVIFQIDLRDIAPAIGPTEIAIHPGKVGAGFWFEN